MSSKLFDLLVSDDEFDDRPQKTVKSERKTLSAREKNQGKSYSARDKNKKAATAKFERDEKGSQAELTGLQANSDIDSDSEAENQDKDKAEASSAIDKKVKKTGADKFTRGSREKMTTKQKRQAKKAAATAEKKAMKAASVQKKAAEMDSSWSLANTRVCWLKDLVEIFRGKFLALSHTRRKFDCSPPAAPFILALLDYLVIVKNALKSKWMMMKYPIVTCLE